MEFATQLRVMRTVRGLSQTELAELVGIPNTRISSMETGQILPGADWEARIRQALGWTADVDEALDILAAEPAPAEA